MVVVVEKERGCLLIFSYPSKTRTRDTGVTGFTGVRKCQPVPTRDLNLYGFVNP